jgi:hypothetical protein
VTHFGSLGGRGSPFELSIGDSIDFMAYMTGKGRPPPRPWVHLALARGWFSGGDGSGGGAMVVMVVTRLSSLTCKEDRRDQHRLCKDSSKGSWNSTSVPRTV